MYRNGDYTEAVDMCAKESMARAAEEVNGLPHYASEGKVRVCRVLIKFLLSFVANSG